MRRARSLALLLPLAATLAGPPAVAAGGHTVRITSTLEPARLTIAPGDTVTWRNLDGDRHRMRSQSGPAEFDSGNLEPGETFRVTLRAVGTYTYIDERDDDDRRYWGTIVVAESPPAGPTDGDGGGGGGGEGAQPGGGGGSTAPATASVRLADRTFSPGSVTIAAGGTVTWRNNDDRAHTATGDAFDSGVMATGATYRKTFPSTGTFSFLCIIHPEMTGTVTVTAGPSGGAGSGGSGGAQATPRPTATPTVDAAPSAEAASPEGASESAGAPTPPAASTEPAAGAAEPEDPPGARAGRADGGAAAAPASSNVNAAGLVSTLLALGLIGGALMVGTGLVLGIVRRDGTATRTG